MLWWFGNGPWFNIKMYRKSNCVDKTTVGSFSLHNGISFTGKMASLYWTLPPPTRSIFPRSHDSLIFIMEIPYLKRPSLYWDGPRMIWVNKSAMRSPVMSQGPYGDFMCCCFSWWLPCKLHTKLSIHIIYICIWEIDVEHWKWDVILTKFSSMAVQEVVKMITSYVSDENLVWMTAHSFQWKRISRQIYNIVTVVSSEEISPITRQKCNSDSDGKWTTEHDGEKVFFCSF